MSKLKTALLCSVFISSPLATLSIENPIGSIVGVGAGVTTEYLGSKETYAGLAPGARVEVGDKVVELYGTYAALNFSPHTEWEYGIATNLKLGRESFVDGQIGEVHELGYGVDTGVFFGHQRLNTDSPIPYYVRRGVTVLSGETGFGDTKGTSIEFHQNQWIPLSMNTAIGIGFGAVWSDSRHNTHYYGTGEEHIGSDWRQLYAWPVIIHKLNDSVYIGAGAYIQKVIGTAADSKLVSEIGDDLSISYGAGLGWTF